MSTFAILLLTLIGLVLFGLGGVAVLPALLVIAIVVAAGWLLFAALGLVFQIIGAVLLGTLGLVASLVFGTFALVSMALLPLLVPVLLLVGLIALVARAGRPAQATRSIS